MYDTYNLKIQQISAKEMIKIVPVWGKEIIKNAMV